MDFFFDFCKSVKMIELFEYNNMACIQKLMKFNSLPERTKMLLVSRFSGLDFVHLYIITNIMDNIGLFETIAIHSDILDVAEDGMGPEMQGKMILYCPDLEIVAGCDKIGIKAIEDSLRSTHKLIKIQDGEKLLHMLLALEEYDSFCQNDGKVLKLQEDVWNVRVDSVYLLYMMKFFSKGVRSRFIMKYFRQKCKSFYYLANDSEDAVKYFRDWVRTYNIKLKKRHVDNIAEQYNIHAMYHHIDNDNLLFLSPDTIKIIIANDFR